MWERFSSQRLLWGNWLGSSVGRWGRGWDEKTLSCSKLVTAASALHRDLSTSQTLPSSYWLLLPCLAPGLLLLVFETVEFIFPYTSVYVPALPYVHHVCTVLKEARRGCQVPRNQRYRGHELPNMDTRNGSQGLCKSISVLKCLSHFSKPKMVLKWSSQDHSNEMISMKTIFQTFRCWPLNVRSRQRNSRSGELVPCRVCGSQGSPRSSWRSLVKWKKHRKS